MTRNRVADWTAIEREYIFDPSDPPMSISDIAEKYNVARSGVARRAGEKDSSGLTWYQRREEFRSKLTKGVTDALRQRWVETETSHRQRLLEAGSKYLDKWIASMDSPDFKTSTKDAMAVAAMMRVQFDDVRNDIADPVVVSPTDGEIDLESAPQVIAEIKRLMAGGAERTGTDG